MKLRKRVDRIESQMTCDEDSLTLAEVIDSIDHPDSLPANMGTTKGVRRRLYSLAETLAFLGKEGGRDE